MLCSVGAFESQRSLCVRYKRAVVLWVPLVLVFGGVVVSLSWSSPARAQIRRNIAKLERQAKLSVQPRARPSVAILKRGDEVMIISKRIINPSKEIWFLVATANRKLGWVHQTALDIAQDGLFLMPDSAGAEFSIASHGQETHLKRGKISLVHVNSNSNTLADQSQFFAMLVHYSPKDIPRIIDTYLNGGYGTCEAGVAIEEVRDFIGDLLEEIIVCVDESCGDGSERTCVIYGRNTKTRQIQRIGEKPISSSGSGDVCDEFESVEGPITMVHRGRRVIKFVHESSRQARTSDCEETSEKVETYYKLKEGRLVLMSLDLDESGEMKEGRPLERAPAAQESQFVVADYLTVRAQPQFKSRPVAMLAIGTRVVPVGPTDNGWLKVGYTVNESKRRIGYVREQYLGNNRPTLTHVVRQALDTSAPLEERASWFHRWLSLAPRNIEALRGLHAIYTALARSGDADAIDRQIRGDFPVHVAMCGINSDYGGYTENDGVHPYVLVGSITSKSFDEPQMRRTPALAWARWPWHQVAGGKRLVFPKPNKIDQIRDQDEMSHSEIAGHIELGRTSCTMGSWITSVPVVEPDSTPATQRQMTPLLKTLGSRGKRSKEASGRTITLGDLRLTSVRVGRIWAVFDKYGKLLHRQGSLENDRFGSNDGHHVGEVQWVCLPDNKTLLALTSFFEGDSPKSTYSSGASVLIVRADASTRMNQVEMWFFTGG